MAVGALFGVVVIRGDAKHVVALDADAMQHGAFGRRSIVRLRVILSWFGGHERILTHRDARVFVSRSQDGGAISIVAEFPYDSVAAFNQNGITCNQIESRSSRTCAKRA